MFNGGRRASLLGLALLLAACGRGQMVVAGRQANDPVSTPPAPTTTTTSTTTSTSVLPPTPTVPLPAGSGPRGRVVDHNGDPVAGATVTLFQGPGVQGPFTPVPAGASILNPSLRKNPLVTGPDGRFAWDALAGFYKITAAKPGCTGEYPDEPVADSKSFRLPIRDYEFTLELDCRPPDANPPVIRIGARPPATTTSRDVRIEFTIVDEQPGSVAFCFFDDEPPHMWVDGGWDPAPPKPCTSPFVRTGLGPGEHTLGILAIDGHDNHAIEVITFTVR